MTTIFLACQFRAIPLGAHICLRLCASARACVCNEYGECRQSTHYYIYYYVITGGINLIFCMAFCTGLNILMTHMRVKTMIYAVCSFLLNCLFAHKTQEISNGNQNDKTSLINFFLYRCFPLTPLIYQADDDISKRKCIEIY